MELIFLRHEKAEDAGSNVKDEDRQLTKIGREKMKKEAEGLKNILHSCKIVRIFSSPLTRAFQTAEIAANSLNIKHIEKIEAIATGSFEQFSKELVKLEDDICLIVVGHEPYLSQWCQRICKVDLPFKKGAAADIKITSVEPLTGELSWFAQSEVIGKL
jgi:phosphohistidine phosphatase